MSTNTPFHQDNATPPPPPFKPNGTQKQSSLAAVPVWAWGLGVLLLALIVTLAITLGGGDKDPEAVPAPAVTITETAKPEPAPSPSTEVQKRKAEATPPPATYSEQDRKPVAMSETEFLGFLREQFPILKTLSDEDIMSYSDETCDALDAGSTPEDVMITAVINSSSPEQAEALGGITGGSVSNYCPEHYDAFTKFLNEQGAVVES